MPRNTAATNAKLAINKASISPRLRRFPSKYIPIPRDQRERARLESAGKYHGVQLMLDKWRNDSLKVAISIARKAGKKPRWAHDMMFNAGTRMTRAHKKTNTWNAFRHCMAKRLNADLEPGEEPTTLQDISRDYRDVYHSLSAQQIKEYRKEYEEDKKDRAARIPWPSIRSKAQDVANAAENMAQILRALQQRCGVEALFVIVRNQPENYMEPQWFFTNDRLGPYLKLATKGGWDTGKVGSRLEAFAIAGCETANLFRNSHDKAKVLKAEIRDLMKKGLATILNRDDPKMHYDGFDQHIKLKHGVTIEGWPLPKFQNPSEMSSALGPLEGLRNALLDGTCHFRRMESTEWAAWKADYLKKAAAGPQRKQRKDAGLPRPRKSSAPVADEEEEGEREEEEDEEDEDEIELPAQKKSKAKEKKAEKKKGKVNEKRKEKKEKKKVEKKKVNSQRQQNMLNKEMAAPPANEDENDDDDEPDNSDKENVPLATIVKPRPRPCPVNDSVQRGANAPGNDNDNDNELGSPHAPEPGSPSAGPCVIQNLPPHLQMQLPPAPEVPTACLMHEDTWRLALDHAVGTLQTFPQLEMAWMTALGTSYSDSALAIVRNAIFAAETDTALCVKNILELKQKYLPGQGQTTLGKRARGNDGDDEEQVGNGKRQRKPKVMVSVGADHHPNSRDPATIRRKGGKKTVVG
ncbi:hypothetical protein V5O48_012265 [Marasmius crinis-equi]|uniref:Uncharacterized protein n=1 Tax=Marasmius crinis-equi TaxID=585013 RepID=A0ABR3F387_9AGAR